MQEAVEASEVAEAGTMGGVAVVEEAESLVESAVEVAEAGLGLVEGMAVLMVAMAVEVVAEALRRRFDSTRCPRCNLCHCHSWSQSGHSSKR